MQFADCQRYWDAEQRTSVARTSSESPQPPSFYYFRRIWLAAIDGMKKFTLWNMSNDSEWGNSIICDFANAEKIFSSSRRFRHSMNDACVLDGGVFLCQQLNSSTITGT